MKDNHDLPRAVICDVDGTLVDRERQDPTPRLLACLERARQQGALVMVASGRIRQLVPAALREMADYCVCGNGGIVLDRSGAVVCETSYAPDLVEELTAFCIRIGAALSFSFPSGYGAYCNYERMRRMYLESTGMDGGITDETAGRDRHLREAPFSAFLIGNEGEVYRYLRAQPRLQGARQWQDHFDIYPVATTKAAGISQVLQRHGIDWKDVIAFGDSPNDLEMLAAAGRGYAMGNACPEAKALTGYLAPPVWEDGAAQVLEKIFGSGEK
ncbi:HAD family phosphatase [Anaerofilum sp. BX8]|uniref:HAD family phosphatase n=1 Tax=Anaerofilum hominis TaxID=2763016 RepID=A0A923I693_9FIRM|nr:HAD family hydrolase [Anaerofilum hominis]MBC5581088.1 HAD family phosphatase [Anaerofilum hominis]